MFIASISIRRFSFEPELVSYPLSCCLACLQQFFLYTLPDSDKQQRGAGVGGEAAVGAGAGAGAGTGHILICLLKQLLESRPALHMANGLAGHGSCCPAAFASLHTLSAIFFLAKEAF